MAVYYQVAGTQLVLPDNARADLAFVWTYYYGTIGAGNHVAQLISGSYVEIPLYAYFTLTTSAAVANRLPNFEVDNQEGLVMAQTASAGVQTASVTQNYALSVSTPTAYTPGVAVSVFGIPTIACMPRYTIQLSASALQAGDVMSNVLLTVARIPTGPPLASATARLPTPLLT